MVLEYPAAAMFEEIEEEEEIIPNPSIAVAEATETYGKFVIGPLEPGYGVTLGNPLRRVLYNSLPGTAITWVKVDGVLHEYSTVPGVKEEVSEILLNIKNVRIRSESENDVPGKLRLEVKGEGIISAADVMTSADFTIVNPDQHIATLDSEDAQLSIELNVGHGTGYKMAESSDGHPIGVIPIDSVFTPVRKVNYTISQTRVGQRTDYEELNLEVWTDGSTFPVEAVERAANVLVNQFFLFANVQKAADEGAGGPGISLIIPAEYYNMTVEQLDLSSRTLNCLKRAGLDNVGQVLERDREELFAIRNFGEKSYTELYSKLREMDLLPEHLDPDKKDQLEDETVGGDGQDVVDKTQEEDS